MLRAGRLRHRVALEQKTDVRDDAGNVIEQWSVVADSLPAEIAPLSAREYLSAQQLQSAVDTRITVRWRSGVTAAMRFRNLADGTLYNIAGVIPDPDSGREWLTLPVSSGVNQG